MKMMKAMKRKRAYVEHGDGGGGSDGGRGGSLIEHVPHKRRSEPQVRQREALHGRVRMRRKEGEHPLSDDHEGEHEDDEDDEVQEEEEEEEEEEECSTSTAPEMEAGMGLLWSFVTAALRMAIAFSSVGMEEWPPCPSTVSSALM